MGLEVVLAGGEIVRFGGKTVKNVTAYDMVRLFTGSEGTLGIITEIIVRLIPAPEARETMLATFGDLASAGRSITGIIQSKVIPATMEIMDRVTMETGKTTPGSGCPQAEAILLVEVDGFPRWSREAAAVREVITQTEARLSLLPVSRNGSTLGGPARCPARPGASAPPPSWKMPRCPAAKLQKCFWQSRKSAGATI